VLIRLKIFKIYHFFIISISSLGSYLYYNFYGFSELYHMLLPVVGIHASVDFVFNKQYDLKIHHLFVLGAIYYNYYHNGHPHHRFILLYPLLNTEISSVFYVLKYWIRKDTILYSMNMILFYLSFFKFRIYDFYYLIIHNNSSLDTIFQNYGYKLNLLIISSCYGLYLLNIYWFLIINKILYKSIAKITKIDTSMNRHFLCSYIHCINIPLSIYIYSSKPKNNYIFDVVGIVILTVSSYIYHIDIYNRKIENYELPDKHNITLFLDDAICIHIRSFLVLTTHYYYNKYLFFILFVSCSLHLFSLYYTTNNILQLFLEYDKTKDTFFTRHYIITFIPITIDVLIGFINLSKELAIPFMLVNLTIALLFLVNPFYKLTHIVFHILLIAQTYYMCLSNSA
jgi:hypothetical protein